MIKVQDDRVTLFRFGEMIANLLLAHWIWIWKLMYWNRKYWVLLEREYQKGNWMLMKSWIKIAPYWRLWYQQVYPRLQKATNWKLCRISRMKKLTWKIQIETKFFVSFYYGRFFGEGKRWITWKGLSLLSQYSITKMPSWSIESGVEQTKKCSSIDSYMCNMANW